MMTWENDSVVGKGSFCGSDGGGDAVQRGVTVVGRREERLQVRLYQIPSRPVLPLYIRPPLFPSLKA